MKAKSIPMKFLEKEFKKITIFQNYPACTVNCFFSSLHVFHRSLRNQNEYLNMILLVLLRNLQHSSFISLVYKTLHLEATSFRLQEL
jgi:hypothetical protein